MSSEEDDDVQRPRFGRGAAPPQAYSSDSDADGVEDAVYGVPSAFGGARARRVRKRPRVPEYVENPAPPEPGAWEKHTRGIGSKLLKKMGFTGRLGARGTGLTEPIQIEVRAKQTAGLGRYSQPKKPPVSGEKKSENVDDTAAEKKRAGPRWKKVKKDKTDVVAPKKPQLVLKERIIDMRMGDAQEAFSVAEMVKNKVPLFAAPEFVHNVQLLWDGAKVELESAKRARNTEKLIAENAQREEKRLQSELDAHREALSGLEKLETELRALSGVKSDSEFATFLETHCTSLFRECASAKPRFLVQDALIELAKSRIRTCFRVAARASPDIADPPAPARIAARILQALRTPLSVGEHALYLRLCASTVLREARAHPFVAEDAGSFAFAAAVDAVREVLHPSVLTTFAEDVLMPVLERALSRSRRDGTPPHQWIHPWLPVVGAGALESLLPALRQRLVRSLSRWDPKAGREATQEMQRELRAWQAVIPRRKLQATVDRGALPKIRNLLRDDAQEDSAAAIERVSLVVRDWADLATPRSLAEVLAPPLWRAVAKTRDLLFGLDATAIGTCVKEYTAWKQAVGVLEKYVRHILAAFLFVIASHKSTLGMAEIRKEIQSTNVMELGKNGYRRDRRARKESNGRATGQRDSILDAISGMAQSHGLAVLPDGRDRDGRALFKIGNARVVIDGTRQVVLQVKDIGSVQVLQPIALAELMEFATS